MTNRKNLPTIQADGPSTSPDPLTRRLMEARDSLMQSKTSFYLGDPDKSFNGKVVWKRIGRGYQLVTKDSATAVDKAHEARAAAEATGENTTNLTVEPLLDPAILSAIIFIDYDDCWLTPCGHWKGPNKITKKFEDLKMSFLGKSPSKDFLSQDFSTAFKNAKMLMDEVALDNSTTVGFLTVSKSGGDAIRFRHTVFEKIDSGNPDNGSDTASEDNNTITMSNWPVINSEAEIERDRLASTHKPIELPAYDLNGDLIHPILCNSALAGAIARVTFALNHWYIENSSKEHNANCFVADIKTIRILVNPTSQATSPKKRKTARRDPGDESPTKRGNRVGLGR